MVLWLLVVVGGLQMRACVGGWSSSPTALSEKVPSSGMKTSFSFPAAADRVGEETETCVIVCMFADTHVYTCNCTSTSTHTSVSCYIVAHCFCPLFSQMKLEVLHRIISYNMCFRNEWELSICPWRLLFPPRLLLHNSSECNTERFNIVICSFIHQLFE